MQGFYYARIKMSIIYDAAAKYVILEEFEYRFVISQKRKIQTIHLNFLDTDFFHIAGLQYLTDVVIPQDRKQTLKEIIFKHTITDKIISKSIHYITPNKEKDISARMKELRFLEEYLDTDNFIKIYNTRNTRGLSSVIQADYLIESCLKNTNNTVYIFIRRRDEDSEHFGIVSFFKKNDIVYGGDKVFWMEKTKISSNCEKTLYIHPNYKK